MHTNAMWANPTSFADAPSMNGSKSMDSHANNLDLGWRTPHCGRTHQNLEWSDRPVFVQNRFEQFTHKMFI